MRTSTILAPTAVLCAALCACTTDTSVGPPPAAPVDWHAFDQPKAADAGPIGATAQERALAEAYLAAVATPGMPALAALLEADSHFAFPAMPDARGRDAVVKAHDALLGAFEGRTVAASRVLRTDAATMVEWTLGGTQTRDWLGVAASRKPVVLKGVTLLWTKDDGKITDIHTIADVAAAKVQLGAGPKELASLPPPAMAAGAPQSVEQAHTPEEASNVTAARAWVDGLERTDDAVYAAGVTDDVVLETSERATPGHGKEDLKASWKALHKAVGQVDTIVENAWGIGKYVVLEYSVNGEQLGPIGWVPAARDRVVRLHAVDVLEMNGGKIAHIWRYDDPGEVLGPAVPVTAAAAASPSSSAPAAR